MGREVRMVPPGWHHPARVVHDCGDGHSTQFVPLLSGSYERDAARWDEERKQWDAGYARGYGDEGEWRPLADDEHALSFEDWSGARPDAADYMPVFAPGTATHYMMYETVSEGTPISPAFATPEELARWLADNGASAFGSETASYKGWLRVARGGYAPSMIVGPGGPVSGVDGLADEDD